MFLNCFVLYYSHNSSQILIKTSLRLYKNFTKLISEKYQKMQACPQLKMLPPLLKP